MFDETNLSVFIVGVAGGLALIRFRRPLARLQVWWQDAARFYWRRMDQPSVERAFVIIGVGWIALGVVALIAPVFWP